MELESARDLLGGTPVRDQGFEGAGAGRGSPLQFGGVRGGGRGRL